MALKIASVLLALAVISNGQVNCPDGIADDDGFCIYEKKGAVSEDKTNSVLGESRSGTLGQQDNQRDNATDATIERQSNSVFSPLEERLVKDLRDSNENSVVANNEKSKLDSGSSTSNERSPSDVAHVLYEINHSLGTLVKHGDSHDVGPNFGYSGREQDVFRKDHSSVINGWAFGDHAGENDRSLGSFDNYSPPGSPRPSRGLYLAPYSGPRLRKPGGSLQGSYGDFSPNPSGSPSLGYFPGPSPSSDIGPSPFGGPSMGTTGGQSLGPSDGPSFCPLTGPTPKSFGGTKYSYGGPSLGSSSSSSGGPSVGSPGGTFAGLGIGSFDGPRQGPGLLPPGGLPGSPSGSPNLGSFGGPMLGPGIVSPIDPSRGPTDGSSAGLNIGSWGGHDSYLSPGLGSFGGPGVTGQGGYPYDHLSSPGYGIAWQGHPGYPYNYVSGPGYGPGYSYNYISGPGYGFIWQWSPGFSYSYITTPGYGISDQGPGYLYNYNRGPGNSVAEQGAPGYAYDYLTSPGSGFAGQMGSSYPQKDSNSPGHNLEGPGYQHIYPSVDGINSQVKRDGPNHQASGVEPQGPASKVSSRVSSTTTTTLPFTTLDIK